jgi:hypothetical protein
MVILLGSVASDPGLIVRRGAGALCQVADTAPEKQRGCETPYNVGLPGRGWLT